jgi:serine/threonine protein kinase
MSLSAGEKLGPYEIISPLGAGGMGEVYRARDTKLKRDVALKVLPEAFAEDPARMARFQRESELLASLNHTNIAHIYGVEDKALVMELVEGESPKGPMPFEEAWKIASQMANALEYAHEKGVVHRDLKPANVKVTPEGVVKLLDFGLAKAFSGTSDTDGGDPINSPTLTMGATAAGTILGTAAYMAPEQAKGRRVDKRADIWSWGVVLYELLTGARMFEGEDVADTLAAVLSRQPEFEKAPPQVRRLLRRCLEKDPKLRLRDIGDAPHLLDTETEVAPPVKARVPRLTWTVTGVIAVVATMTVLYFRHAALVARTLRYTIAAPENSAVHSFAISPDGSYVVIAASVNGKRQLWMRPLNAFQAQPLPSTEDATYPFWSPDSRYIGFFAQSKLKKIAANGGPAQALCNASNARGGSWGRGDVILFSAGGAAIQRVPASGGVPSEAMKAKGRYWLPGFLPDGRHFLYLETGETAANTGIYVGSLDSDERRRVLPDASSAVFAAGHLIFLREDTLMAQAFDPWKANTSGEPLPIAEGVSFTSNVYVAPVTASETGVLLFMSGGGSSEMDWVDRTGKPLGLLGPTGSVWEPAISPNQKMLAFRRQTRGYSDIWLRDLARETDLRVTSSPLSNLDPMWSPDGDRILFNSNRAGPFDFYLKAARNSGQDQLLLTNSSTKVPDQWSRDGRFVVYTEREPQANWSLWVLPMTGATAGKPAPFLRTAFNNLYGQLSPDGHWMAYTSDESGQREVYVRPFPAADGVWRISRAGGEQPRWRADGKELFFVGTDAKMTAVTVKTGMSSGSLEASTPVPLFETRIGEGSGHVAFQYDVSADGKRFVIATAAATPSLNVVMNWDAELRK